MNRPTIHGRGRLAALVAVLALLAVPALVSAHAELATSDPEDGATVEGTPGVIVADFTETLADGSGLVLSGPDDTRIAEGGIDESNDTRMSIEPPDLAAGDYVVRWTAVAEDGHVERGSYSFTVTEPATPEPTPTAAPSATPAPTAVPSPTAAASVAPSPTPTPGAPAASTSDALLPILAAVILVAVLGGYLLNRRRSPPSRP